jgi:glycosyltransferase involved in cell wall biosynthesis
MQASNACGVPVIAPPHRPTAELIEEGRNGFLASPEYIEQIEALLRSWADNPHALAALKASCRASAEDRFGRNLMLARYALAFEDFING